MSAPDARIVLLWLLAGCASSSSFQTADVLRPGGWEAGGDLSAALITGSGAQDIPYLVLPRGVVRVGLLKRLDLGASVGLDGVRLQPKIQLTKPGGRGLIVSVAPALRVLPLPTPNGTRVLTGVEEGVLVGLPFAKDFQLVGVGRGAQDFTTVDGDAVFLVWAGGSVGLSWQALPGLRLMPEVGAMAPLYVTDGDTANSGLNAAVFQLGVGIVAGRR